MVATAVVVVVVEAVAVVCKSVNRVVYLKTVAEVSMPPYTCQIWRKLYTRHDSLTQHIRARHSEQGTEESDVNTLKGMISLDISIVINVDKILGLRKVLSVILCKKRKKEKSLHSLNVCIV